MAISEKDKLAQQYAKSLLTIFRLLEVTGFARFVIRNGKIVARSWPSVLYNMIVVIMIDVAVATMLSVSEELLTIVELISIVHFMIFTNFLICHITFGDKYRGQDLMQNFIEIDHFLGAKETVFMQKLAAHYLFILVGLTGFTQVLIVVVLYYFYHVGFIIHVVGSFYFFWIVFSYNDFCFFLFASLSLTTRVRYVNVALLKKATMKIEYIPKKYLFHKLFWRDEYNDRITFHRAERVCFRIAYKMMYNQFRQIERCYRFPITIGAATIMMGTFMAVQTFIMYVKASAEIERAGAITGWAILSWFFLLLLSFIHDMFDEQIEQTKLICAYIQLKPSSSEDILQLTKDLTATLDLRPTQVSLYNIFFFNTGLVFKLAASTFVYITVQLQLAFPNIEDRHKADNVTKPADFNLEAIKEFMFVY